VSSDLPEVRRLLHDLRSPVAVIDGFAQLLERGTATLTDEQRADYTRRIVDAAAEIKALLDGADVRRTA
jgi:nitrogen-specific signal transduction histidine kinase